MIIVEMKHFRQLHNCSRGVRRGFQRYNLDYSDFLKNGISADKLLEVTNNDSMVLAVVEVASGERE